VQTTDPLVAYRLGAVRVGIQATVLALVELAVFRLLPGHGSAPWGPYLGILVLGAVGAAGVRLLPWERLFQKGVGVRWLYGWSVLDILLITGAVGFTGGGRSELFLLYGLTTVFFGAAYPPRGQIGLLGFTFACYLSVLGLTGWHAGAGAVFIRCGVLGIVALLVSHLSAELLRMIDSLHETGRRAERSAILLSTVARSARQMSLERDPVLESLVDSVIALGFNGAAVCIFDHEAELFVVTHQRGLPVDYVDAVHPANEDMPGRVRGSGRTQVADVAQGEDDHVSPLVQSGFRALIASPIWVDGWLAGTLLGASDISGAVSALEEEAFELLSAQAGMAMENAQRFEETLDTVERLQELDKLKDDFLATASHEIRTPLTVILGSGTTLEQMWDDLDEPTRRGLVTGVNRNARTLEGLMGSLLDFTQVGAESLALKRQEFEVGELLREVTGRLGSLFGARPIELETEAGLTVQADPFLIERVIENLLSNAARHTPEGTRVLVSARPEDGSVAVSVSDDGQGLSEEDARHLGERFFRAGDINIRSKGLGLGLALVREILELHGTDLEIDTSLGAGSRFTFRLPAAASQGEALGTPAVRAWLSESEAM
jgi:signal transduction histidine kinase